MRGRWWRVAAVAVCLVMWLASPAGAADGSRPRVKLVTSLGEIVIELYPDKAPASVANFLAYVREGFYDGLVFHRVIPGFVIQAGGLDQDLNPRPPTHPPVRNEADNGLKNRAYTVALARTPQPHSATSQFFINLRDNPGLDHTSKTARGWGYAVFGRVVEGRQVVDRIAAVPTGLRGGYRDVPLKPVVIRKAEVIRP